MGKKKKNRNQYRLQADCLEIRLAKRDVGDFIGTSWIWFSSLAFREKKSSALAQAMPGDWGKWACFFHMAASGLVMGFVLPRTTKKKKKKLWHSREYSRRPPTQPGTEPFGIWRKVGRALGYRENRTRLFSREHCKRPRGRRHDRTQVFFHQEGGQTLECAAQSNSGTSANLTGQGPEGSDLTGLAWGGGWTRWSPETLSRLNYPLILWTQTPAKDWVKQDYFL